ncbi:hypothetical protein Tel_15620 [Candidatus Tenderia electrophaga]|jgi:hypothetical protein|uniref:DUF3135 domain-containing protein n=1 Tax=Candidatus Tenderia electrophaga TaxID=1748243 RepID=A0A0S2TH35_9GAMM|nr:hypothetical protein Tel_15620 [Candidatus Tenderia electrophaga]
MSGISNRSFVFDEWKKLAETNPKAFEFTRRKVIDDLINEARASERLKCLQWRIDVERERAASPLSACVRLSNMMLNSLYGDGGLAKTLNGTPRSKASAEVVSLKKQRTE